MSLLPVLADQTRRTSLCLVTRRTLVNDLREFRANPAYSSGKRYPGTPIGQLVLFHAGTPSPPTKLSGSYLGPVYPEAPKMKAPREMLKALGMTKHRRPGHGWIDDGKIRDEISAKLQGVKAAELKSINAVIEVLIENGAFPSDTTVLKVLRTPRSKKP